MNGIFLYTLALGVASGIAAGLLFTLGILPPIFFLCAAAALLFVSRKRSILILLAIFCASVSLGLVRTNFLDWQESQITVSQLSGHTATVVGVVSADPDKRATNTHVVVAVSSVDGKAARGKTLAEVPTKAVLSYGDTVEVRGVLQKPQPFAGGSGREFDYPAYLRVRGIYALMPRARVVQMQSGGFSARGILFSAKHALEASIENIFPQPSASLVEGVLLGERKGLPKNIENALVAAGLIHIVILAGYALSLVSQGVLDALSFLHPRWRYALAAVLLISFVLMTGAAATTVRACAMAAIAMLARYLHRSAVALRSLAAVCAAMILWNPLYLLYDESFIISALATFGLIALSPLFERWFSFLPRRFDLRGIASSTLSVQVFALRAVLYFTGTLSVYALPANMLALPALPLVMFFGFLSGVLGLVHPLLAFLPALLANLFLHWILFIAQIAASLPLGGSTIPAFPVWIMIVAYIPLFLLAIHTYRKHERPLDAHRRRAA